MPYSSDACGIYAIVNTTSKRCYIGQSRRTKKRLADHFNLLRSGRHPNPRLQNAFRKHGPQAFSSEIVALCEDPDDLDAIEEAFISGNGSYGGMEMYNISKRPTAAMAGRTHSPETKRKISSSKAGRRDHITDAYRQKLSEAQLARNAARPDFVKRVDQIIALVNEGKSYAEAGRIVGSDTGSVRKLYLKYRK